MTAKEHLFYIRYHLNDGKFFFNENGFNCGACHNCWFKSNFNCTMPLSRLKELIPEYFI